MQSTKYQRPIESETLTAAWPPDSTRHSFYSYPIIESRFLGRIVMMNW